MITLTLEDGTVEVVTGKIFYGQAKFVRIGKSTVQTFDGKKIVKSEYKKTV